MKHIAEVISQAAVPELRRAYAENARLRTAIRCAVEAYDSDQRGSMLNFILAMRTLRKIADEAAIKEDEE